MRVFVVLWIGLLTAFSVSPFRPRLFMRSNAPFHDLAHIFAFAVTAFAFGWNASRRRSWFLCFGASLCLAIVLELLEKLIFPIHFEWRDVLMDVFGIVLGLIAAAAANGRVISAAEGRR